MRNLGALRDNPKTAASMQTFMKHIVISITTVLGISFFAHHACAQQGSMIDSLKIIPANPTVNDEIQLVAFTTFPTTGCDLTFQSVIVEGNYISVTLEFTLGDLTAICNSIDTLQVGMLPAGTYELNAILMVHPLEAIFDTGTIEFTVENALNTGETTPLRGLDIFPNPCTDEFQIKTPPGFEVSSVEIISAAGSRVAMQVYNPGQTIDMSGLRSGVYLVVMTDAEGNRTTGKVVKSGR